MVAMSVVATDAVNEDTRGEHIRDKASLIPLSLSG